MDANITPLGDPLELLERRLFFVRRNMKARQWNIENLPHALSEYRADTPPVFLWDIRLSTEERTLAGVHEMVHAVLHPPGSTSFGKNETSVEERIVHYVAGRACDHFGVESYTDFIECWHIHPAHIEDDEQGGVELLLAAVIETLEAPDDLPVWLGRGNFSFGIETLERAWDEASTAESNHRDKSEHPKARGLPQAHL